MDAQTGLPAQIMTPTISVGLPVYNGAPFLRRAIDSILASTFPDFELIISDNGSTDETSEICADYARRDPRVRVITQSHNIGPVRNFQAVVYPARGKYFMWMADDDIWHPHFMRRLMDELDAHPKAVVAMCAVDRMREMSGSTIDIRRFAYVNIENGGTRQANFHFLTSSTKVSLFVYGLFRTEVMKKGIGLFPHALGGDRQFLCQFALAGEFRYVDEVLYRRAIRISHEWSYRLQSSKPKVLLKQFFDFCTVLLRSPLVPLFDKIILPFYAYKYARFIMAHALTNLKHLKASKKNKSIMLSASNKNGMKTVFSTKIKFAVSILAKLATYGGALVAAGLLAASVVFATKGMRGEALEAFFAGGLTAALASLLYTIRLLRRLLQRANRPINADPSFLALKYETARILNKGFKTIGAAQRDSLQEVTRTLSKRFRALDAGRQASLDEGRQAVGEGLEALEASLRAIRDEAVRGLNEGFADAVKKGLAETEVRYRESLGATTATFSAELDKLDAGQRDARAKIESLAATMATFSAGVGKLDAGQREARDKMLRLLNKGFKALERDIGDGAGEVRRLTDLHLLAHIDELEGAAPLIPLSQYAKNRLNMLRKEVRFSQLADVSRLRELYLAEIFPDIGEIPVPIGAMNELTGHANKADMLIVCAIAKQHGARRIFEFGTHVGRTSYHLMQSNEEAQVFTLDIGPDSGLEYGEYIGNFYREKGDFDRITQILEDSRQFDTTPYRHSFDFVFVDADHSYNGVKNDTVKALELVRPGGIIMWHDYAPKSPGLVEFFRDFTPNLPLFRIKNTPLLLHIDGVDPLTFEPHPMVQTLELAAMANDPYNIDGIYHT